MIKYQVCWFLFFLAVVYSCTGQNKNDGIFAQEPTVHIQRFDIDLHNYLQNPSAESRRNLEARYKDFLPAFGRVTINSSDSYKEEFYSRLQRYFSNDMLSEIYTDALSRFDDVTIYEQELSAAENIIKAEFNGLTLPALFMHISGFKENVMVLDNVISLSSDKYLGSDYPVYKKFFEPFQISQMKPEMISRDYLKAWILSSEMIASKKNPVLLDEMVFQGKVIFFLSKLLPAWEVYDLIGFTKEQESWCRDNEQKIWQTIVQLNHLYDQDYLVINKYMNEAPYTATLSTESPGRAGVWVGWKIVNEYMQKNSVGITGLLKMDAQQVLKASGYNP